MYNCNNNNINQNVLELKFSDIEQLSTLKNLFFYLKKKPKKYELKNFSTVEKLLFDSKDGLTKNELIVLKHFIENRKTNLYDIKKKQKLKQEKIENLYRYKNNLVEKKLLNKKMEKRNKINELSNIGIFYLLLTEQTFNTQTQKQLLLNYKDSVIFTLFVYPYISYDSIKEIDDSGVFSNNFLYLRKCCEQVIYALSSIDSASAYSYNGYPTLQLFFWKNYTIENINEGNLKFFLTYHLKLPWIYNAEIKKDPQDKNIIRIEDKSSTSSNKAIIRLLEDKSKANLIVNRKIYYDKFIIRKMGEDYYSVEDFEYSIDSPDSRITVKENSLKILLMATQQEVQILIFSILLSYGADMKHPLYEILKKDKTFMQSLKKTNHYFNQRYNDITK